MDAFDFHDEAQGIGGAAAVIDKDDEVGEIDVVLGTVAVGDFKTEALVFDVGSRGRGFPRRNRNRAKRRGVAERSATEEIPSLCLTISRPLIQTRAVSLFSSASAFSSPRSFSVPSSPASGFSR
jgi:hypothetical protein